MKKESRVRQGLDSRAHGAIQAHKAQQALQALEVKNEKVTQVSSCGGVYVLGFMHHLCGIGDEWFT